LASRQTAVLELGKPREKLCLSNFMAAAFEKADTDKLKVNPLTRA
jgi:hypothetical protein